MSARDNPIAYLVMEEKPLGDEEGVVCGFLTEPEADTYTQWLNSLHVDSRFYVKDLFSSDALTLHQGENPYHVYWPDPEGGEIYLAAWDEFDNMENTLLYRNVGRGIMGRVWAKNGDEARDIVRKWKERGDAGFDD